MARAELDLVVMEWGDLNSHAWPYVSDRGNL